jgi:hypothetical protein
MEELGTQEQRRTAWDRRLYRLPDISSGVLYCFVAASRRAAMLTLGDRYDASILNRDPMAPFELGMRVWCVGVEGGGEGIWCHTQQHVAHRLGKTFRPVAHT